MSGAYILTVERWSNGTLLELALQRTPEAAAAAAGAAHTNGASRNLDADTMISIRCKVIRQGEDGVGVSFMPRNRKDRAMLENFLNHSVERTEQIPGTNRIPFKRGQALVEYAFMLPFMLLLIVNVVNFGAFLYTWIEVANAARAGAQYAILSGASAGSLNAPTGAEVAALIQADLANLPGTPTIAVCRKFGATVTSLSGTCPAAASITSDPESTFYTVMYVDVTYTFVPLTGDLSFPKLGLYATIPTTTVRRKAYMRVLQ